MCTQTQDKYKRVELSDWANNRITRLESQLREMESMRDEAGRRYVKAVGDLHERDGKIAQLLIRIAELEALVEKVRGCMDGN